MLYKKRRSICQGRFYDRKIDWGSLLITCASCRVRHLVLDEADKLMDLGFLEQTDEIFAACSNDARKAMFSATFTPHVEDLAMSVMKSPVRVVIGTR